MMARQTRQHWEEREREREKVKGGERAHLNVRKVQSLARDICRHQNVLCLVLERVDRLLSHFLVQPPVNGASVHSLEQQVLVHSVNVVLLESAVGSAVGSE